MWYKLLPGTVLCYINDGSPLQIVPINWKPYLCAEINRALFWSLGLVNTVVSWILEQNQNSKQRGKSLQLLFKTQGGRGIKRCFSNVIGQVLDNRKKHCKWYLRKVEQFCHGVLKTVRKPELEIRLPMHLFYIRNCIHNIILLMVIVL